jgi:hypothetical protein
MSLSDDPETHCNPGESPPTIPAVAGESMTIPTQSISSSNPSPAESPGADSYELLECRLTHIGPGRFPGFRRPFRSFWWSLKLAIGSLCLVLVLAVLAAIPGLNILTLGYLVEPQRRVALSGRLRDGFPLLRIASRLGTLAFFTLLFCVPLRIQATRLNDAMVILGPAHRGTLQIQTVLTIMQWVIGVHLLLGVLNGSTAACFLRPLRNLKWLRTSLLTTDGRKDFFDGLNAILNLLGPIQHFLMGLRAFFGAICWLVIPTSLLVAYSAPERKQPVFGLLSVLGVLLMIPVAAWLPLLQVQQAVTGKFRDVFSVSAVRRLIRNAPLTWMITTVLLYVMTFPLYLGKVRLPPADALLILTPFFILLTYPARILVAWAWHRGNRQSTPARTLWRRGIKLLMIPLLAAYGFFLLLTPFISELGRNAPFENQAFLGPVPYAQWSRKDRFSPGPAQPKKNKKDDAQIERSDQSERPEQARPDSKNPIGQP